MKKKLLSLMCVAALLVCGTVACGNTNDSASTEEQESAAVEETVEPVAEPEEEEVVYEDADVRVAALKGPTAMGMVQLMDAADNDDTASNHYTFTIAAAPDEITPSIVQGNVDIAAVPANLASVLFNKTEGKVQVLAINTLGVLYIVENGETISSVEDLKGKTIYASGKGATPEFALNYMLTSNGIDPEKDVTIEYKSEHAECVAALTNDEDGVAMLPQPFATTALMQNENMRIALDMTTEWESAAKASGSNASLVTGVVVARTDFVNEHPDAVKLFMEQYAESTTFTNDNVEEASELIEKYDIIKAAVAKQAIPYCNIRCISGTDMKDKLSGYLQELFNQNPEAVGGKLPTDEFYYIQ